MVSPVQVCGYYIASSSLLITTIFFLFIVPDPCLSDPCNVNAICVREGLLTDNFTCTCLPPFTEGNGFTCSSMFNYETIPININNFHSLSVPDPCLSTPCDPNALCERESLLSENFTCTCLSPFTVGDGFNCSSTY